MHITQQDCFRSSSMRAWWEEAERWHISVPKHADCATTRLLSLANRCYFFFSDTLLLSRAPKHQFSRSFHSSGEFSCLTTGHINTLKPARLQCKDFCDRRSTQPSKMSKLHCDKQKCPCLCSLQRCIQVCWWICRFMPERFHWFHSSLGWSNWMLRGP